MADYLGGQYGTGYPVPNSSIGFDWLKQMLGITQDGFAVPQISPSGLPPSYEERAKLPSSQGGFSDAPRFLDFKRTMDTTGTVPPRSDARGAVLSKTPAEIAAMDAAPKGPPIVNPNAAYFDRRGMFSGKLLNAPVDRYRGNNPNDAYAPTASQDGLLSSFPARPDYTGTNVMPGVSVSQFAARPDFVSNNSAPVSDQPTVGNNTATPSNPNEAFTPAAATPAASNLINSGLFGTGEMVDPSGIDPATGLTNAQALQMKYNVLGSVGSRLLAAGQLLMPKDRAAILAGMGDSAGEQMNMMTQMQQRLLQNNKLARENAAQANLMKIMQSPGFQQTFSQMAPEYQALAKAAAESGDLNGVLGLIEKSQPQFSNSMIINRQAGVATDTISGQKYDLKTGAVIPSNTTATSTSDNSANLSTFGIPQGVRVNGDFFNQLPPEYKQRLARVASGEDTLSGASHGNAAMMQRMQMDVYRAFPDYNPTEASNRAAIIKSFAKSDSPKSLYGQSQTLGTFAQHNNGVLEKAQKLDPGPLPAWDAIRNEFLNQTGDPRVAAFNTELHMLQGEVGKMVKAGVLTDNEQNALNANISAARSPAQIRDVLDAYHELVGGRIRATDAATQRVMGDYYDPKKHSLINAETQKQFDKFESNPFGRTQTPQGKPKAGNYKWTPNGGLELQ